MKLKKLAGERWKGHELLIYAFLVVFTIIIGALDRDFWTVRNVRNILLSSFPLMMVAFGQSCAILTGGIDLSLGAVVALSNVVCVSLMDAESPVGFLLPVAAAVAVSVLCGALNGIVITRGGLAPIIATLASTTIFEGAALWVMPKPGGNVHRGFARGLTGALGFLPYSFLFALAVLLFLRRLTNHTAFGKAVRAVGGNEPAAYSTGVRVRRVKLYTYCLASGLASLAGIFLAAQMFSGDPLMGKNYSMNAVTASVMGGILLTGASGDLLGTAAGVLIVTIINNMLNLLGVSSFYQYVFQGVILIAALSLAALRRRK